ncbi:MAG: NAD(+) synthase [Flavobacteriaceae bacterium]
MKYPEKVSNYIVSWINNYVNESGVKGLVVGISGGVDSALTSTLCAKTGQDVLCLEMPIYQNKDQVLRSRKHIDWLKTNFQNVTSKKIELDKTFESFVSSLPNNSSDKHELSLANTRSRLRMVTLYYFSGLYNYIVAGTGNKVEDFGIGFYTKYGDGGVDISPIADLLKSEVFSLAKFHNIINEIIVAEPNDGLWNDNRSDEDQIGASYEEIENAMINYDNKENLSQREKDVLKIYYSFNIANKHKMDPIPVCKIPKEYL